MTANTFKFNGDKTEFMVIGTRQLLHKLHKVPTIHVEGSDIQASPSAKNIGLVMDQTLSMNEHTKNHM